MSEGQDRSGETAAGAPERASKEAPGSLGSTYPVGSQLPCRVSEVLPIGVVAHPLHAPQVRAFIPRQEWTWQRRILELGESVDEGDLFDGEVTGYDRTGLLLSRKSLIPDPFLEFIELRRPGDRVVGRFLFVSKNEAGIVLEIGTGERAVDGFVPRGELPPAALDLDGFGLLEGDLLAARILRSDRTRKNFILSVRDQLRRRDVRIAAEEGRDPITLGHSPKLALPLEHFFYKKQLSDAPGLTPTSRVREEIRRILLIEDEEAVADSLRSALERAGFEVETALHGANIRETLEKAAVDLMVLDRNLHGTEGTELLRDPLILDGARFICILTGTPSPEILDKHRELAARGRLFVLDKPTPPDVLLRELDLLLDRTGTAGAPMESLLEMPLPEGGGDLTSWLPHQFGDPGKIEDWMAELRTSHGADYACVLSYEAGPLFRRVAGNFVELTRARQQLLEISPVGSVIRERGYLFDNPIEKDSENQYRHLTEVIEARSFLGFGLEYADRARYGLFLIREEPGALRELSPEERSLWELRVTQHLVESRFSTALVENQSLLLKGLLTSALVHEVGNRLQTLADHSALQVDVVKLLKGPSETLCEADQVDLLKSTDGIRVGTKDLEELVRTFRNLFGSGATESVRLDFLLASLERTFRSVANRDGLYVRFDVEGELPTVKLNPKLLEQPILNLLLNAKEQMVLRGSAVRRLWLSVVEREDEDFPLQIRVRDTGPGIHARDQKRIFDLFFTTKPKGTGLGLFIASLLIERFGGRLRLESSILFEGSEFRIDLPGTVLS